MCLLQNAFWLTKFLTVCKISEQCEISELPRNSRYVINMKFIYKITEVKICVSLREHHNVIFAEDDAALYMPYKGLHR